jgi:hypothetical protein
MGELEVQCISSISRRTIAQTLARCFPGEGVVAVGTSQTNCKIKCSWMVLRFFGVVSVRVRSFVGEIQGPVTVKHH